MLTTTVVSRRAKRNMGVPKFLQHLYNILSSEDKNVITWCHGGRAFEIKDFTAMEAFILPKYFKHGNYASFQRQLNYFKFKKWAKHQTEVCTFSHPHFIENQPDSMKLIKRRTRKLQDHSPFLMQQGVVSDSFHRGSTINSEYLKDNNLEPVDDLRVLDNPTLHPSNSSMGDFEAVNPLQWKPQQENYILDTEMTKLMTFFLLSDATYEENIAPQVKSDNGNNQELSVLDAILDEDIFSPAIYTPTTTTTKLETSCVEFEGYMGSCLPLTGGF